MRERNKILLSILLGFSCVILWNFYYNSFEKMYTIGIVNGTQIGKSSGISIIYEFNYNGKKYLGSTGKGDYSAKKGDRFIVEFGKNKQSLSSILLYYPIPDSLNIKTPLKGWNEVPQEIKKFRLKIKGDFGLREYFHEE
jgi:hypothetical protein